MSWPYGYSRFEDEMVEGYLDGRSWDSPEPSANRSHSYRHGFANGRDDLRHQPRAPASRLIEEAAAAIDADEEIVKCLIY